MLPWILVFMLWSLLLLVIMANQYPLLESSEEITISFLLPSIVQCSQLFQHSGGGNDCTGQQQKWKGSDNNP